ncbi:MAG: hypothetical protein MJE77_34755 [Proteobacteria bacterium]|nr:hypothetical protein [Pseudomonadota bacterium]
MDDPPRGHGSSAAGSSFGLGEVVVSGQRAGRAMAAFIAQGRDPRPLHDYETWLHDRFSARYALTGTRRTWASLCGVER